MSLEPPSELEQEIQPGHAEQLRNALSTIIAAELQDRDLDEDTDPEPIRVGLDELVRAVPFGRDKCRALMEQNVREAGTGITNASAAGGDRYEIDAHTRRLRRCVAISVLRGGTH